MEGRKREEEAVGRIGTGEGARRELGRGKGGRRRKEDRTDRDEGKRRGRQGNTVHETRREKKRKNIERGGGKEKEGE